MVRSSSRRKSRSGWTPDAGELAAIRRARELREAGLTLRKIGAQLHAEGHTARILHPQSVARAIESRVAPETL